MSSINNGDMPAFPGEGSPWFESQDGKFRRRSEYDMPPEPAPGLTKREEFAARAMEGLLVGGAADVLQNPLDRSYPTARIAERAVTMADLLLAELAKRGGS